MSDPTKDPECACTYDDDGLRQDNGDCPEHSIAPALEADEPVMTISRWGVVDTLLGEHPWVPGATFIEHPGLAQVMAEAFRRYEAGYRVGQGAPITDHPFEPDFGNGCGECGEVMVKHAEVVLLPDLGAQPFSMEKRVVPVSSLVAGDRLAEHDQQAEVCRLCHAPLADHPCPTSEPPGYSAGVSELGYEGDG